MMAAITTAIQMASIKKTHPPVQTKAASDAN
jgi:hypothetical protein